ncbi:hypothetical protein D3C81_706470 [compost metagenome]
MQQSLFSHDDLRHALNHVQSYEALYTYTLAGMLNEHIKRNTLSIEVGDRGLSRTIPIIRFDVGRCGDDSKAPDMVLELVIEDPNLHAERITLERRSAENFHCTMRNIGWVKPAEVDQPKDDNNRRDNSWGGPSANGVGRVELPSEVWRVVVQHQIYMMRTWMEAFEGRVKETKHFSKNQTVVWTQELQIERFPNIPMFKVVAMVEPLIKVDRHGCTEGLVDVIIVPTGFNHRGYTEFYAHSSDLLTLDDYERRLLDDGRHNHATYQRHDFKLCSFMVEEVINKIPAGDRR